MSRDPLVEYEKVPIGTSDRITILFTRLQIAEKALLAIRDFDGEGYDDPGEIAIEALNAISSISTPDTKDGKAGE